jgi:hypothetical protein
MTVSLWFATKAASTWVYSQSSGAAQTFSICWPLNLPRGPSEPELENRSGPIRDEKSSEVLLI